MLGHMQTAGVAPQGAPPQQAPQVAVQRAGTDTPTPEEQGGEAPTPEEQAMYDKLVNNAKEMIYPKDGGVTADVAAGLKGELDSDIMQMFEGAEPPLSGNPVDNLAATAAYLVLFLDNSATEAGQQIPDDVMYFAGVEILEDLSELAEALGIHEYSDEHLEGALYRAVDLFRISSARVDPEALKLAFEEVVTADREGRLGEMLPGIGERMKGG